MRRIAAVVFLFVVLFGGFAIADEIVKKDGTKLEGEVIEEDDDSVTIRHKLGDIKVPRADITTVTKKSRVDVEAELETIKRETCAKLETLAQAAEGAGKAAEAKAIRATAEAVTKWTSKPKKGEDPPAPKTGDFTKAVEKIKKLREDNKLTDAQRQKAYDEAKEASNGRLAKVWIRMSEVVKGGYGDRSSYTLTGSAGPVEVSVQISDPDDIDKLGTLKRGSMVQIEGIMRYNTRYEGEHSYPAIEGARVISK